MKNQIIGIFAGLIVMVFSFAVSNNTHHSSTSITSTIDYEQYLSQSSSEFNSMNQLEDKIKFWSSKLEQEPNSSLYQTKLAALLSARFKALGNIEDITFSDQLLQSALTQPNLKTAGIYHALSSNAITQHQFRPALKYADQALETQEDVSTSQLMRFDALMELGDLEAAKEALNSYTPKNSFDYLIRKSKLQDAEGDLSGAIRTLEMTKNWVEEYKNPALYCWVMSNLGDMYGHAGRVEASYEHYLKSLKMDNAYLYALKGIAWIAYSKDNNTVEAKRIINFLKSVQSNPDYDLMLAEIAAFENDEKTEMIHTQTFIDAVGNQQYGQMYNSHLVDVYLSSDLNLGIAKKYAIEEINNRPTAQSYLLLARYQLEEGNPTRAMQIVEKHVIGKTEEPDVLYHIGRIAQASGKTGLAKKYLNEASEASFELGPVMSMDIQETIQSL